MLDAHLFDHVADAVQSMMGSEVRLRSHRRGLKAWFGPEKPPRAHYEAQVMPRRYVDGQDGTALEIGFHAEHKDPGRNDKLVGSARSHEKKWRKQLGEEAEIGVFFGADQWRRISEVWIEPDLDDPELSFEIAARLVDYLTALGPIIDLVE